jgi:hypothetical protein
VRDRFCVKEGDEDRAKYQPDRQDGNRNHDCGAGMFQFRAAELNGESRGEADERQHVCDEDVSCGGRLEHAEPRLKDIMRRHDRDAMWHRDRHSPAPAGNTAQQITFITFMATGKAANNFRQRRCFPVLITEKTI